MAGYEIAGLPIETPLISTAGSINGHEPDIMLRDVTELAETRIGAITLGSFTINPELGNAIKFGGRVVDYNRRTGIMYDASRYPNIGCVAARKLLPQVVEIAHAQDKPVIASVMPDVHNDDDSVVEQAKRLVYQLHAVGADLVEVNATCLLDDNDHTPKSITGYDLETMDELLDALKPLIGSTKRVGVKLPVYNMLSDLEMVPDLANIIRSHASTLGFISTAHSIDGFSPTDAKGALILSEVPGGFGGKSGPVTAGIGFSQLKIWKKQLEGADIDIISMLGVHNNAELTRRINHGAAAAGGTTFLWGNKVDRKQAVERMLTVG